MKHLKCLLSVLVFAAGFVPTAFAQVMREPQSFPIYSALEHGKPLSPTQERRMEDLDKLFAKKSRSVRDAPYVTLSLGESSATFRLQKQVWVEQLSSGYGSSSKVSLESSKLAYTYRCSNIFRSIADGRAFSPFIEFVEKKFD